MTTNLDMLEIADILFLIKSLRNPTSSFNINNYITFHTASSQLAKAHKLAIAFQWMQQHFQTLILQQNSLSVECFTSNRESHSEWGGGYSNYQGTVKLGGLQPPSLFLPPMCSTNHQLQLLY